MRYLFSVIFISIQLASSAQLLNPAEDWFGLSNFFNANEIASKRIRTIQILSSQKKDGKAIKKSNTELQYNFDSNGRLIKSLRIIKGEKPDSSSYEYNYNDKGLLYKKAEISTYYHFVYYYFYEKGLLVKSMKIDAKAGRHDTLYSRKHQVKISSLAEDLLSINEANIAFLRESQLKTDSAIVYLKQYLRNGYYHKKSIILDDEAKADKIKIESYQGKKTASSIDIKYRNNKMDECDYFEENILLQKRGILYNESGLVKEVVERNYQAKDVVIYHFSYF